MSLDPRKLILLDRDGVINQDSDNYIKTPEEWHPIPGSLEAISALNTKGIEVIVVTNQSGLARGFFSEDMLDNIHEKMKNQLSKLGGHLLDIFYCPHHPDDNCDCRKPSTAMLDAIEQKYQLSLSGVPFIGDTEKDLELAYKKSCLPILVKTGKGAQYFSSGFNTSPWYNKSLVFNDLHECAVYLLQHHYN